MSSGAEVIMLEAQSRLIASATLNPTSFKRTHRTAVTRDDCPAWRLMDGEDKKKDGCRREVSFSVALFVRSDDGSAVVDAHKIEIVRRLSPITAAWPEVAIDLGRCKPESEPADQDITRVDIDFSACYSAPEWSLG